MLQHQSSKSVNALRIGGMTNSNKMSKILMLPRSIPLNLHILTNIRRSKPTASSSFKGIGDAGEKSGKKGKKLHRALKDIST